MDGANEMASWATDDPLWFVAGAAFLLILATLKRQPHPNHVFFLQLIERLEEATCGDSHGKPMDLSSERAGEAPGLDHADGGSNFDPNLKSLQPSERQRDRRNRSASTDLAGCGAGGQEARKR